MEAGRELDDCIAEKVMEWHVEHFIWGGLEGDEEIPGTVWITDASRKHEPPRSRHDVTTNRLPFSTDIATAWRIIEHMHSRAWICYLGYDDIAYHCRMYQIGTDDEPVNCVDEYITESMPLAICRAALKAVGVSF